MKFIGAFCKNFKLLVNRFCSFFTELRKSVENDLSKEKIGVTKHPRTLNPGKAIAMAICSIIVHFIT